MEPESHALEVMEQYFEDGFNELDQLGLWKQTLRYARYKVRKLQKQLQDSTKQKGDGKNGIQ